jgi:ABC-type antimicrobial peptide transport system permease subunit
MSKFELFLLALKNFSRRKARSVLTIVGVVIGSAAIVIMLSLGIGVQDGMMKQISTWGDLTTINMYAYNLQPQDENDNPYLRAIEEIEGVEHVVSAMPISSLYNVRLVSGKYVATWSNILLVDAAKLSLFGFEPGEGRGLQAGDELAIVINPNIGVEFLNLKARNPYDWSKRPTDENGMIIPYVDVYNDKIQLTFDTMYGERVQYSDTPRKRAKLYDLEVVGYQNPNGSGRFDYSSLMDRTYISNLNREYLQEQMKGLSQQEQQYYRDMIARLDQYDELYIKIDDMDNVAEAVKAIQDLGYEAYSNMEYVEQVRSQLSLVQTVMGLIGAVSLLVAAINIANTMIMSIYERTKEIGIMKVIGCRLGDICMLFLLEAGILGLIGGVIGIGLSYGGSALLNNMPGDSLSNIFGGFYIDPSLGTKLSIIPIWLVIMAVGVSVGIAVLAGLYPSVRAMRLSALEAIRNE